MASDGVEAEHLESDWVRVSELIDSDGDPTLQVTHSETLTPWKLVGMLQAAADYHRELVKNIFFSSPFEDDEDYDLDDTEDED